MSPARLGRPHLLLFASLYAIQGIVVAYFFNFNQGYLHAAGVADATIGWVQTIATLPLIVKFLGGVISDRCNFLGLGHRRPYIALGLAMQSAGLIGLTLVYPTRHLAGFTALATLAVAGLSLYDTCCDGMILDVTPVPDRGRVQGTVTASRFAATAVFSLGFGRWLQVGGTGPGRGDGVIWTCALLAGLPFLQTLLSREPRRGAEAAGFRWSALRTLTRPRAIILLCFGALYATIAYGVELNLSNYYHRLHFGEGDVGNFAAARYLGRAVGAGLLPIGARRLGRAGVLWVALAALAGSTAGQGLVESRWSAGAWGFAFGAANGWTDALFGVMAMEAADPRLAASTYALIMAASNVSVLGSGLFSEAVAGAGGDYRRVFLLAAAFVLLAAPMVPTLRGLEAKSG